ncbi:MAG: HNH endonuclease [Ferruginibacter sp.]
MVKDYIGEKWKPLELDFPYTNKSIIEFSNFGRVRTFNKVSDGNIMKGSMINGYKIIRLKLFSPRDTAIQHKLDYWKKQITKLDQKIRAMKENDDDGKAISESIKLRDGLQKQLSQKFAADTKKRTINYHVLVHRLVAEHFMKIPSAQHTIVAHLNYDKLNNRVTNLKWMTPAENYEHQQHSPYVIKRKEHRRDNKDSSGSCKLSVTKVMLLKKLLNQGKPLRSLVKQFKVSDTQILRIKRGENWGDIKAAT